MTSSSELSAAAAVRILQGWSVIERRSDRMRDYALPVPSSASANPNEFAITDSVAFYPTVRANLRIGEMAENVADRLDWVRTDVRLGRCYMRVANPKEPEDRLVWAFSASQLALREVLRVSEHIRFTIPKEPGEQAHALERLLADLQNIQYSSVLEEWLDAIISRRITLPVGIPSDSPSLMLIKRIFQLSPRRGLRYVSELIRRKRGIPFSRERFQLSLVGVVIANCRRQSARRKIKKWAGSQLRRLLKEHSEDKPVSAVLMGGILAIKFLSEEDTLAAAAEFKLLLTKCLTFVPDAEERSYFLQFFFDALSQHVSANNISNHLVKIIAVCGFVADENSVVWPRSGILGLIRDDLISPVRQVLKVA